MADTPDLGAAQEAFNSVENEYKEVETTYNDLKTKFEADQENEEIKTAFTGHEAKYNETKNKYQTAKDTLFEALKKNVRTGYWPEDWRENAVEAFVGKDGKPLDDEGKEKLLKRLSRYASPREGLKALIEAQNKISSGKMMNLITKDSTPEEIAEYRQTMGIPEKPENYDLTMPNGLVIGDEDKESINEFLQFAHASNYTNDQVKQGLAWYYKTQEDTIAKRNEADVKHRSEAEEILRQEWGPEYKTNINLMANYLSSDWGQGIAELIVGARLADGTPLANHPEILKGFVAKARKENPFGALIPGSGTKQHESMIAEIEALEKEMGSDAWYKDQKKQDRYKKLIEMRGNVK